ncbi:MAG TPA: inositol monophosphatase family protein [Micromonosporaceae bacterium]
MANRLTEEVADLLRRAAATAILPVFRRLDDTAVEEKAPGEVVTVADRDAELIISDGLEGLLPGSSVVGEEAVAADPAVLQRLRGSGPVWLVDPIDGTANFAAGRRPFAVMVALVRDGVTEASWILDPISNSLAVARAADGAYLDGVRVEAPGDARPISALRGVVASRLLPPALRTRVDAGIGRIGEALPGNRCAGREYPDILRGVQDFVLFWRTLPWDHAPGVLLVEEAGGVARRFDGSPYDPTDDRSGLLVAANPEIWMAAHQALLAD